MLGWVSRPAARASVWKRVRSSGRERPVPSSLRRMVLTATVRPMTGSTALKTIPIAPRPSSPTISYLPAFVTVSISLGASQASRTPHQKCLNAPEQTATVRLGGEQNIGCDVAAPGVFQRTYVRRHLGTLL